MRAYVTHRHDLDRVEARFPYDPLIIEQIKLRAIARWDPAARCWWAKTLLADEFLDLLSSLFDEVIVNGSQTTGHNNTVTCTLPAAVDLIFRCVSRDRRARLAKAMAAAAHPDGDGPDRAPEADQLVRLATERLR